MLPDGSHQNTGHWHKILSYLPSGVARVGVTRGRQSPRKKLPGKISDDPFLNFLQKNFISPAKFYMTLSALHAKK